jgi:glycosyltransferase involved in cell wall biosynthesis
VLDRKPTPLELGDERTQELAPATGRSRFEMVKDGEVGRTPARCPLLRQVDHLPGSAAKQAHAADASGEAHEFRAGRLARVDETPVVTVIVPTAGRRTLRHTLQSIRTQAVRAPVLEVLVVADGSQPAAQAMFDEAATAGWRYLEHGPTRAWGHHQKMHGIAEAHGRYFTFLDDDDVYVPRALQQMLVGIAEEPDRLLVFRLDRFGLLYPRRQELRQGVLGTGNLVVPNLPGRIGSFTEPNCDYISDFQFISQTVAFQGPPAWRDEIITICDQPYWLPTRRKRSNRFTRRLDRLRSGVRVRTRVRALIRH